LIQPRDVLVLQERPDEAFARYLAGIFHFDLLYTFVNNGHALGTVSGSQ
jgi:hypothetical protein